jgi:D-alanyl-lipoteichoic acid acyltransferase DltB (MBOAT superfamily)
MISLRMQLVTAVVASGLIVMLRQFVPDRDVLVALVALVFSAAVVGPYIVLFVLLWAAVEVGLRARTERPAMLVLAISGLVVVLVGFKLRSAIENPVLGASLFVPLGLSYFVFQLIGYAVDVRRGVTARGTPAQSLTFAFLPPLRICGPILRHREFARWTDRRRSVDAEAVVAGLALVAVGVAKKRWLGDWCATQLTSSGPDAADVDQVVVTAGRLASLFFDASAFGEIALGLGMMMGIKMPASFNRPLTNSRSLADFWRRWQMPIMGWFRDYVYAPVKNRGGPHAAALALAVSFLVSSAWHGLNPAWFVWGIVTVLALRIDAAAAKGIGRLSSARSKVVARGVRRAVIYIYLAALTTLLLQAGGSAFPGPDFGGPLVGGRTLKLMAITLALAGAVWLFDARRSLARPKHAYFKLAWLAVGLASILAPGGYAPFVYQRF